MNGMVIDSWPYVIASFVLTWVVLVGYSVRLFRMMRRNGAAATSPASATRS